MGLLSVHMIKTNLFMFQFVDEEAQESVLQGSMLIGSWNIRGLNDPVKQSGL